MASLMSSALVTQVYAQSPSEIRTVVSAPGQTSPKLSTARLPSAVENVLWWFPEDTETLMVSQGSFSVPKIGALNRDKPLKFEEHFHWSFSSIQAGEAAGELQGRTITLSMEGSRRFRQPKGLGMMPFEGATVLQLAPQAAGTESLPPSVHSKTSTPSGREAKLKRRYSLAGKQVSLYEKNREYDLWQYYIVWLNPNTLIVATDERYLISMLYRMRGRRPQRAFPVSLPEWRFIDTTKPYWALRHYAKGAPNYDPSSPLSGGGLAAGTGDLKAIGLTMDIDSGPKPQSRICYLSNNPQALDIMRRLWRDSSPDIRPQVRTLKPGVIEVRQTLKDEANVQMFVFYMLGVFGHAILV
jgi:hypothetical protein